MIPGRACALGGGQDTARAWLSERFFFFFLFFSVPLLFPVSRVNRDLVEVGISGHGADRCDQDDEIYIMVQASWSGSSILGVERLRTLGRERRHGTL